ncbi:MAG: restriction endonuclease subunit S [Elusimicrobia bacterium]|nr:restriction endonuclease subunit S [Elusimicrobiota bacterium]
MKFGLSDGQLRQVQAVLSKFPAITEAVVFGSRAMGNYREASDVDLALKGDVTAKIVADVKYALEEETYLPFFFDVIAYVTMDAPKLKEHIDKCGVTLYRAGWREYRFPDFVQMAPQVTLEQGANYSFVEMSDLQDGNKFCSASVVKQFTGSGTRFQDSDTLFARITPCLENGKICQVRNLSGGKGFGSTEFHVFRGKKEVSDTDFVFYLSRCPDVRDFAEANFHGTSGRQRVPKEAFDTLFLNLPPLPEQRAIADVLSSLDEKIDLLQRQNSTLEGLAAALWRKMFVEEAETGWKVGKLGDFIRTTSGGTPSRRRPDYYENGNYKWVKSKELHGAFVIDTEEKITDEALSNCSAKLLPKNSLLLAMYGATVGEYGILSEQATCNQAVCVLFPNDNYPYTFIYMFLKKNKEEIINHAVGSAQQNISQNVIQDFDIFQPNRAIIQFHKSAESLFDKIKSNLFHIRALSRLRDTLLPKLISGEVRVKA